jgi:Transglutaminase-like superfamily
LKVRFLGAAANSRSSTPGAAAPAYRTPLLNGEPGTAQTIRLMRQLIDHALADAQFVRLAIDIVRSVSAYDDLGEAEALYNWVKRNIRFTKDPVTKEKLYPPEELLKIKAGDCDDIAMLLGALLIAVGYPARLVTVSANPENPQEFSHVYVEGEVPPGSGNWIAMDAARLDSQFGIEPPTYFRKRAWSLTDDSYQDLSAGRLRGSLAGYTRPQLGDGVDYNTLLQMGLTEIPAIISTAGGGSSSVSTPQGSVQTAPANPWGSFLTPYSPGYGVPPAGYGAPYGGSIQTNSILPWLIGAGLLLLAFRGHR